MHRLESEKTADGERLGRRNIINRRQPRSEQRRGICARVFCDVSGYQ